ncbi:MAG: exosome complex RNA-binding protein Csl4 [Promethearchaeota archaeon]
MTNKRIKDGDQVLPGDRLGVIEEFLPGPGTFQDQDDVIYASITGLVRIDMSERKIHIEAITRTPIFPQRNDIIIGDVQHVGKKAVIVNIFQVGGHYCPIPYSGSIYIKNAAAGYVEQMRDLFQPGDIIIARVQKQILGMARLSTVGPRLGVIHSSCSRCGQPLTLQNRRLVCTGCGNIEQRKLSKDYGKVYELMHVDESDSPPS